MKEYQKPSLKITGLTPEERLACASGWENNNGWGGNGGYSGHGNYGGFSSLWEFLKWLREKFG